MMCAATVFVGVAVWPGGSWADDPAISPSGSAAEPSPQGVARAESFALPDPGQNARLQQILSTLGTRPGQTEALAQLESLLSEVLEEALALGAAGRLDEMAQGQCCSLVATETRLPETALDSRFVPYLPESSR